MIDVVIMRSWRDAVGITYTVCIETGLGDPYDGDDGIRDILDLHVKFGRSDFMRAAGRAFEEAAQLQAEISGEVWDRRDELSRMSLGDIRDVFRKRRPTWWTAEEHRKWDAP